MPGGSAGSEGRVTRAANSRIVLPFALAVSSAVTPPSLLGACLAFDMRPADLAPLRLRLFEPGVLTGVIRLAAEENNVARLADRLLECGLVPPDRPGRSSSQATLRRHLAAHAARREAMALHLREMVAGLNETGIRPLLLKGARSLWEGEPGWRYLRDIDLLVPGEAAEAAQRTLRDLGYGPDPSLAERPDRHHLEPLYKDGFPGWTEIHRSGGNRYAERLLPTSELVARSAPDTRKGLTVLLPDRATHLLHALIHHHVGHSADARGTLSLKGLYEFAWALDGLSTPERQHLAARCLEHPRLAAMLDYWLAAASLLFHLPVDPPFAVTGDALARARNAFSDSRASPWKYPGYGDELRMAWATERLRRLPGGDSAAGRLVLRARAAASMLPTLRRRVQL